MREQISALRREMKRRGIFAYLVTTEDFHGSEYVGAHFKSREYLSGFTGSAGTLVVTEEDAALWTDGRYHIQAEQELAYSGIRVMKQGEEGVPSIEKFLAREMPESSVLGFDGRCVNALFAKKLGAALRHKNIAFETELDLVGEIWTDRPPLSKQPVFRLPFQVTETHISSMVYFLLKEMRGQNADCLLLSALDEIAWLLNLRGGDVDYNPVFLSFMLVFKDRAELYAEESIFDDKTKDILRSNEVIIFPYESIYTALESLEGAVWIDTRTANFRLRDSLKKAKIIAKPSPAALIKARKTPAEIAAMKQAHIRDGVAVVRFMRWLKSAVQSETVTEISAAEKLEAFRKQCPDYLSPSFEPIMAYGWHGAIVHYSATEETNAVLKPRGLLLSDTGAHYFVRGNANANSETDSRTEDSPSNAAFGTTDITRTFVLGELSEEEKRAFTLALAAHLELLGAVFPKGARGSTLDGIARKPLWDNGLDFNHGTGHGVGFLLNVHEGPQRISYRTTNDAPLEAGMITSNEPGLYFEGKFGVRHESLVLCEKAEFEGFLKFTPLTCVPFDRDGIDVRYLTERQLALLNNYHEWVFKTLSPELSEEEINRLAEATKPIMPYEYRHPELGITIREEPEGSGCYLASFLPEYNGLEIVVPEELDGRRITGITFLDMPNKAVKRIWLSKAVEYVRFALRGFGGRFVKLEIAEENPYLKTDGKALYSKKGELLTFYAVNCTSYEVLPGTRVIKDCAFWKTPTLRHVKLPQGVEEIRLRAFFNLPELCDINIPDTVLFLGRKAFYGCEKLEALHLPSSVEIIGDGAIPRTAHFRELTVDPHNPFFTVCDGILYTKDRSMLLFAPCSAVGETFEVPGFVRAIGAEAFFSCDNLKKLILPPSVFAIEKSAFEYCYCLVDINLENVRYIEDRAFKYCTYLNFTKLSCEEIGDEAFSTQLAALSISGLKYLGEDTVPEAKELELFDDIEPHLIQKLLSESRWVNEVLTMRSCETGELLYKISTGVYGNTADFDDFLSCFKPNGLDFAKYDAYFEKLFTEKNPNHEVLLIYAAYYRIKYPRCLSENTREIYRGVLTRNMRSILGWLIKENKRESLPDFFDMGIITNRSAPELIALSTEFRNPEFTAYFLELKNKRFPFRGLDI